MNWNRRGAFNLYKTRQAYGVIIAKGQWFKECPQRDIQPYGKCGVTPPVADIPRKTAADLGRGVAGTNGQRLQEFLTNTEWDYREMDRLRSHGGPG